MLGLLLAFFITPISRGANPDFTSDELLYQLRETKASLMIVHPETLDTALSAAEAYGISPEHIVLFDGKSTSTHASSYHTVGDLVKQGLSKADPTSSFVERILQPGEAKIKLAFLSFSSGTSGKPKVCPFWIGYLTLEHWSYCRPLLSLTLLR
jgi:4-coumarate--CoA ligase